MCMTSTDTAQIITTAQTKSIFPAPTTRPHEVVCGEKESQSRKKLNRERNSWLHVPKSPSQKDISAEKCYLWMLTKNDKEITDMKSLGSLSLLIQSSRAVGTDRFRNLQEQSADVLTALLRTCIENLQFPDPTTFWENLIPRSSSNWCCYVSMSNMLPPCTNKKEMLKRRVGGMFQIQLSFQPLPIWLVVKKMSTKPTKCNLILGVPL